MYISRFKLFVQYGTNMKTKPGTLYSVTRSLSLTYTEATTV